MVGANYKIIHIASDEKFIDAAIYIFEKAFPGSNHFIIPKSRFNRKLIYVKKHDNIELVPNNRFLLKYLLHRIQDYDWVILHSLNDFNSSLFISSGEQGKFVGIFWGAELYTKEVFPDKEFLGKFTSSINLPDIKPTVKDKLRMTLSTLFRQDQALVKGSIKQAASKLSYFAVPYEEEFNFFQNKGIIPHYSRFIPFTYYPLEFILKGNEHIHVNGNDILIGNSANYTNNHLEVFYKIIEIGIGNRKVILPLSYGDAQYGDYIHYQGVSIFGPDLISLRQFMPLEQYTLTLQRCGIIIMNHYRQQAIGNIVMMIWMGAKVYLNESNSFYNYLKRIGVKVFSIDSDLTSENKRVFTNLEESEAMENRRIITAVFSETTVAGALRKSLEKMHFKQVD